MSNWLPRWLAPCCARKSPSKPRKFRVECLEDRAVPATLSINDVAIIEVNSGDKDAIFTVTLSEPSAHTVSVRYSTTEGTASDQSDYRKTRPGNPPTLTFAPGETTKTFSIKINGDTSIESDETFFVNLSNAVGATIQDGQGLGTIINDDGSAPFAGSDTYSVNEDGTIGANVLANDTDPQNNPLTAILVSGPSHGSLTLNSNGSFTYSPNPDYNGPDTFTYKASDGSNIATSPPCRSR